jgi:hypothetical protein
LELKIEVVAIVDSQLAAMPRLVLELLIAYREREPSTARAKVRGAGKLKVLAEHARLPIDSWKSTSQIAR